MTPTPKDPVDALMAMPDTEKLRTAAHYLDFPFMAPSIKEQHEAAAFLRLCADHLEASARALAAVPAQSELQESVRWKQLVHMVERGVTPEILVDWINHPDRLDYAAKLRAEHG